MGMESKNDPGMMPDEILEMLARKATNTLSDTDGEVLDRWIEANPAQEQIALAFFERMKKVRWNSHLDEQGSEEAWKKIQESTAPVHPHKKRFPMAWSVAAAILILLSIGWFLMQSRESSEKELIEARPLERNNKAFLVLSNGEKLTLDSPEQTLVEEKGGITIVNKPGEVLAYDQPDSDLEEPVLNNLIVPAGARYRVQLSEGTQVWINSVTELEYPTFFAGSERRVRLKGEAYFEVAADPDRPFVVEMEGYTVQVLGTSFNVSAYADDPKMETTLVEGKVRVQSDDGASFQLNPGQQIRVDHQSQKSEIVEVDTRFFTSWKDGVLHFNKVRLQELTTKLERWYNVEFEFTNEQAGQLIYSGAMENSRDLGFLLDLIEQTADVTFVRDNNTIVVH